VGWNKIYHHNNEILKNILNQRNKSIKSFKISEILFKVSSLNELDIQFKKISATTPTITPVIFTSLPIWSPPMLKKSE
ncbi:MAG: hypothetical protein VW518_03945, partial [Burkholderiaceae bacterium]